MPGPARVEVRGGKELRAKLREIGGKDLLAELKAAHKQVSELLVRAALPHVPVRSGRLRATVKALASQRDARAKAGSTAVPYARAIHWGRKRGGVIEARPFLWDAAKQVHDTAEALYDREVEALLKRETDR